MRSPISTECPPAARAGAVTALRAGRARTSLALALLTFELVWPFHSQVARAHEGGHAGDGSHTRFEHFLLSECTPCVTESHRVAALPTGAPKISGLPRSSGFQPGRTGEIGVEVLRAYQLGRPSRQLLALRTTLSVNMGARGELYRVAAGLVDEDELPALAAGLSDIARLAGAASPSGVVHFNASVRGGSLRMGLLRLGGETVAYAQAGDLSVLALRAVWDVPTTIYLPPEALPAVAGALGQAAAKIRELRGNN